MTGSSTKPGQSPNVSAPHVAKTAPMWSWPSPPTLISQILPGTATATAARTSGVILTSVSENPYQLASVLEKIST